VSNSRTNEWDGQDRLAAVNSANQRTEFTYDGLSRLASIRYLTNGTQASLRRLVWSDNRICEERDESGAVTKRFFKRGVKIETGANAGAYYYTSDHLGSIREVTDSSGSVRARYDSDPYGRRTRLSGDLDVGFAFAGMFWSSEAGLAMTRFRAYDPQLGRWLSRDPLSNAEAGEGPNLYAYVRNNPVNSVDPLGLCCEKERHLLVEALAAWVQLCIEDNLHAEHVCIYAPLKEADPKCIIARQEANKRCLGTDYDIVRAALEFWKDCVARRCKGKVCSFPDYEELPPQLEKDFTID
jgi:RHS repeat-associated protein